MFKSAFSPGEKERKKKKEKKRRKRENDQITPGLYCFTFPLILQTRRAINGALMDREKPARSFRELRTLPICPSLTL